MQDMDQNVTLAVEGMTCGGCTQAVENVIREVPGVREVKVDLASARAEVKGSGFSAAEVAKVVQDAGFQAKPV